MGAGGAMLFMQGLRMSNSIGATNDQRKLNEANIDDQRAINRLKLAERESARRRTLRRALSQQQAALGGAGRGVFSETANAIAEDTIEETVIESFNDQLAVEIDSDLLKRQKGALRRQAQRQTVDSFLSFGQSAASSGAFSGGTGATTTTGGGGPTRAETTSKPGGIGGV